MTCNTVIIYYISNILYIYLYLLSYGSLNLTLSHRVAFRRKTCSRRLWRLYAASAGQEVHLDDLVDVLLQLPRRLLDGTRLWP